MNIIIASINSPDQPLHGDSVIAHYWVKHLSKRHKVISIFFGNSHETINEELNKYCLKIVVVPRKIISPIIKFIKSFFLKSPASFYEFNLLAFHKQIFSIINDHSIDVLILLGSNLITTGLIPTHSRKIKKFAVAIDSVPLTYSRYLANEKSIIKKIFLKMQIKKWEGVYHNYLPLYDKIIFVSQNDIDNVKSISLDINPNKILCLPNGVDTDFFDPNLNFSEINNDLPFLLFTGSMYSEQSQMAIEYFIEIFKKLKCSYKNLLFYIVGRDPNPTIKKICSNEKDIYLTGYVNDIRPYLKNATVYIAPLINGTGIKNRILEAMAMKCAIVTTNYGASGLEGADNVLKITNKKKDFYSSVATLIENEKMRKELGEKSREYVLNNYSWSQSLTTLEAHLGAKS
jgi:glycosyltransferase involved in cell wall biosynthesis